MSNLQDRWRPHDDGRTAKSPQQDRSFLHRAALFDGVAVLFLLAFAAVWYAAEALLLVFACILFAILLYDVSVRLHRRLHIPRGAALALLVCGMLLLFVAAGGFMAPMLARQTGELLKVVPAAMDSLREELERLGFIGELIARLPPTGEIGAQLAALLPRAGLFFSGVLGAVGNIAIIVFVGIYFAAQPRLYIDGLITLVPHRKRRRMREVLDEIGRTLAQWLRGKIWSMLIVGAATALGLALLGMPLALILGILAGALDFIPYLGPVIASVPAVLIAFTESPTQALYVALMFVAVQALEGYLLLPLVEKRTVSLPPALTVIMQVLLGTLFGLAGVALATPLTAVLAVLVTMLYVQDVLGDEVRTPSQHPDL
ncbi:MAG TPA: AI-2E family transporter [Paucimonas sp.]|nr:AI-2E family transporter [Paucimonas sp.]